MIRSVYGSHFCGNKIGDYGLSEGYVDYATFAKAFDGVLNNDIMQLTNDIGYWEEIQGTCDTEDEIEEKNEELEALEEHWDNVLNAWQAAEELNYNPATIELWENEYNRIEEEYKRLVNEIDELESINGDFPEVFQFYIVSYGGADLIQNYTNDPLWYNETLDMYVWGITHWGTAWTHVLTDIRCNTGEF